jgi:hypothetical protein
LADVTGWLSFQGAWESKNGAKSGVWMTTDWRATPATAALKETLDQVETGVKPVVVGHCVAKSLNRLFDCTEWISSLQTGYFSAICCNILRIAWRILRKRV